MRHVSVGAVLLGAALLMSQSRPAGEGQRVGPLPDGGFLLNSGWRITPAGKQVALDTLPMSTALSPDGKYLLILNAGFKPPTISVLRTDTAEELGRTPVPDGWLGLTFSPDGKAVYIGGGSRASLFELAFADGKLTPSRTFTIVPEEQRTHRDFIGDVAWSPDGRLLYAAGLYQNAIYVINPQSGRVIEKFQTGRRPYRILFHPDGQTFFVSSWADGSVYQHNSVNGERVSVTRLGPHPTDMVWRPRQAWENDEELAKYSARLFVAAANTNTVYVIGVTPGGELWRLESINMAMTPRQPLGMTPTALALSADARSLYAVCSGANAVAVVDLSEPVSIVAGFVPTGWYPTAARALSDGRLVVLNGRGGGSYPNPNGPKPTVPARAPSDREGYVAYMQTGTASIVEPFDRPRLNGYSDQVVRNSPYRDELLDAVAIPEGNPIPSRPGGPTPIRHVIYIVKENRTYDQVLGDLEKGNGDASLVMFGEGIAPNHRKLAREFVLFDNFYVNGDVGADGHNWSAAAIANDYVQRLWPSTYGQRRLHDDYEGGDPTALPPAGYLWTNAAAAGVSMRNYGWWATNGAVAATGRPQISTVRDPVLARVTNTNYRAFDLAYADVERAKVFLADLQEFEKTGAMPQLVLLRLGNDHTAGAAPGELTPAAYMADNDLALGTIVQAVSKTKFWPATAIFVVEDDAQNGADHVDSHRSLAFVVSPYTRRGALDNTMYNTTSVLRTIELILGLRPMTHFDAAARPMWAAFSNQPDVRPYEAVEPQQSREERNPATPRAGADRAPLAFLPPAGQPTAAGSDSFR